MGVPLGLIMYGIAIPGLLKMLHNLLMLDAFSVSSRIGYGEHPEYVHIKS